MPRLPALLRTKVAPAPSPNSTAVARSVQSMIEVSFSEATTSTCSACSEATRPSATLSAYRKPVHAAWTSNAAACLAPSSAWRSQACEGSSRSGEQVATTRASISRGVRPVSCHLPGGRLAHAGIGFVGPGHAALADPGPLADPLVRRIEDLRELIVRHHALGRVTTGSHELRDRALHRAAPPPPAASSAPIS